MIPGIIWVICGFILMILNYNNFDIMLAWFIVVCYASALLNLKRRCLLYTKIESRQSHVN